MNKYEQRFKERWQANVDRIARLTNAVKQYEEQIDKVVKNIEAIDQAKEVLKESGSSPEAVQALKDKMADLHKTRSAHEDSLARTKSWLGDAQAERKTLQELCPHENTVYDHEDYHRREDFYRCTLCGVVR